MRPMPATGGEEAKREFGRRVRTHREGAGVSQEAFALKVGLDRTYISGIERGIRNVSLVAIVQIADGLGCDTADLTRSLGIVKQ